ncbi:phage tail assembly protein T [Vibrio parahaemolyticus]
MDLAREFGQVCWRTLLASISGQAVVEWREYFSKHGFKHQMDNWRFAVSCSSNWNVTAMAAGCKDESVYKSYQDFIPTSEPPEESKQYTDEELMALSESAGGVRLECADS